MNVGGGMGGGRGEGGKQMDKMDTHTHTPCIHGNALQQDRGFSTRGLQKRKVGYNSC